MSRPSIGAPGTAAWCLHSSRRCSLREALLCELDLVSKRETSMIARVDLCGRGPKGSARKYYSLDAATLSLDSADPHVLPDFAAHVSRMDNASNVPVYENGTLFHGPGLQ